MHGEIIESPSLRIYVNKIENRTTFEINLENILIKINWISYSTLKPETMK